ncbi:MAG TPA: peptidoglycan-binding domain-containing protein [Candidatus Paceibacterota bacterium]|nr:peptidoglycan-binding domain-containing protein [Candidatus Paceibacterota bacterium]
MNSKKLVSAVLTATTLLWAVGAAALPVASAQTTASLQAQIAALLAQIQQLQSQLNASGGTSTSMTYDFTSDLTIGSTGAQVSSLQQLLISKGYLTAVSAPTGYFGPLTQSALAKFQAANGISPAVGYFGPITRSFVNSMSTTTTTTTGGGTTTPTGAPLSVSVDAQTPGSSNIAAGAVNTPVLKLDFTAGATPVTVTNLVLTRTGLSQDSDLNNVYLYNGATKLASNLGINNGSISFSNGAGLFTVPANSTYVVTVTADVWNGGVGSNNVTVAADSGHIFQIGLASASAITANGGTFTGNFPLESGQFTIASVNNLATLTISNNTSASTTVNAGQTDYLVGQFTVQAGNNPVKLNSITFTNIGSTDSNALQNIKLMNGSTQLGATVTSMGGSNTVTFDLSGAPLMLTSGQSAVLSLYADITGGSGRSFQFSIQQSSDVHAEDTTYGVGIGASVQGYSNNGGFPVYLYGVGINNGGLVITKDASSPTTYAVAGNTNQVLGVFDVLASGDSVKFNELDFPTAQTSGINNFRVVDDQGAQIGTTVNLGANATGTEGTGSLNYIIPSNTTRVLTVYGDIPSSATGTVQVSLGGGASSAQDYTTFSSVSVTQVAANSLTILSSSTNLVASLNYGLGSPVQATAGASNVKIGSYTFTAGQVNPVNLTGISINTTSSAAVAYLRNLRVMNGSTQVGTTQPTVAANTTYNFNSSAPISIAANGSVTLDVYADVNSSLTPQTVSSVTNLTGWNASTQTGNAVTFGGPVGGQNVTFSNGGTLTGSLSAGTSQASFLGMGITGVTVAQYQFVASTTGSETLTQMTLLDSSTSTTSTAATDHSTFINYRLTDTSGNVLGTATENSSGVLVFNLTGLSVPANSTAYVNLVADTNSYPYATSGGKHAFALTSYQYTNASTATTTNVVANNIGNLFTVYQTTLDVSGASFSNPNSISGVGNIVGEFNFTAGSGSINPKVLTVQLSTAGTIITSSTVQVLGLYDASAPSTLLATTTMTGLGTGTATFANINSNQWTIPYSSTRTLLVKTYTAPTNLATFTGGSTGSYQVLLQGVSWTDGVTGTISSLSPSTSIPVTSQNITGLTN